MAFRCFSDWCVIPLFLLLGQLELFSNNLTMKYTPKIGVGMSEWWTSSIAQYTGALPRPSKWSAKWTYFASSFCLLMPRFIKALDLLHRAMLMVLHHWPSHHHGYRNGLQWRCIRLVWLTLSFDQNVAKRPCYGPFKLTLSYYINLIGVTSLFVSYWPLLPTMDAALATIVTSRQAWFWQHTDTTKLQWSSLKSWRS